ncbi:fimbrial protein [Cronobacter dublinensis]
MPKGIVAPAIICLSQLTAVLLFLLLRSVNNAAPESVMRLIKCFFTLCLLAGSLWFMPHASAACTTNALPQPLSLSNARPSSTTDIGDTIAGMEKVVFFNVTCDTERSGDVVIACFVGSGEEVPGMPGVYETGISGIGITLYNHQWKRIQGKGENCDSRNAPLYTLGSDKNFTVKAKIALVKIGSEIGEGNLNSINSSFLFKIYDKEKFSANSTAYYNGYFFSIPASCSVDPKSLTVNMGDIPATQFAATGTTTPWKNFTINVHCDDWVYVSYLVTPAEGIEDNQNGVIKLINAPDSATGVGAQIGMNNNVIQDFWSYTPFKQLSPSVPETSLTFGVRYYQTDPQVTPGRANTAAMITIAYQ